VSARPERLVLVAGTGTEVGKTWVTCRLARALAARGLIAVARKPAQSYGTAGEVGATDAELLAEATGDRASVVCPPHRWYPVSELVAEMTWPAVVGVGLVESAGGVRSPIAVDGDTVTLAEALNPDRILLVADAGLGTINGIRLSEVPLRRWPVTVVLNRYDPSDELHRRNWEWLVGRDGFDVAVDPAELVTPIVGWPT
jgi:dethiobiotin synthetase